MNPLVDKGLGMIFGSIWAVFTRHKKCVSIDFLPGKPDLSLGFYQHMNTNLFGNMIWAQGPLVRFYGFGEWCTRMIRMPRSRVNPTWSTDHLIFCRLLFIFPSKGILLLLFQHNINGKEIIKEVQK